MRWFRCSSAAETRCHREPDHFSWGDAHNCKHETARAHAATIIHRLVSAELRSLCGFNRTADVPSFGFN